MASNLKLKKVALTLLGVATAGATSQGSAQESRFILEEVVVTAQKRAESLQDTPIAITAFTSSALADKGVNDISEIANFTPNLVFDTTSPIGGVSSGAAVFIRGIGNTDFSLTTDPGVGTYVDGVYVSRSVGGVLDVLDVERIEVLRGPQGTLFGRNTIGGAINIVSRTPADEFQAAVEATLGNDGRANLRASLDIPFSDTLKSSWSLSSKNRDGFVSRPLVGDELGDEQRLSFRSSFNFEPNDNWDFQASFDYTDIDESAAPSVGVGFTTGAPPLGAGVVGAALVQNNPIPLPTGTSLGVTGLPGQFSSSGDFFEVVGGGLALFNQSVVNDIGADVSFGTGQQFSEVEVFGASFVANYHADNFDVKYTGSFRNTESRFANDADNSPFQITEIVNDNYDVDQVTHELQITGTAFNDRFKYAAGVFYFDEDGTDDVNVPVSIPAPPPPGALLPPIGFEATIRNDASVENSSEAFYFQGTYDINDVWSVTGGIRYTEDDKGYAFTQVIGANLANDPLLVFPPDAVPAAQIQPGGPLVPGFIPLVGDGTGSVSETFDETQFKFGVDAKINDNTLAYYSFSQGFKSGGFVLRYVAFQPEALSFEPETLDTHEIGVKWESADSRYRINAAAYTSDYLLPC